MIFMGDVCERERDLETNNKNRNSFIDFNTLVYLYNRIDLYTILIIKYDTIYVLYINDEQYYFC